MTILDPKTGDTKDENNNVVIPYDKFRQRYCNNEVMKGRVPRPVPVLTKYWDEDTHQYVDTIFVDRDRGGETDR